MRKVHLCCEELLQQSVIVRRRSLFGKEICLFNFANEGFTTMRGTIRLSRGAVKMQTWNLRSDTGTRFLSTCPVTGATSSPGTSDSVVMPQNGKPRSINEVPGPKIYPVLGSLLDFKEHAASLHVSSQAYYKKYGKIVRQSIICDEVIIYDPREYIKGDMS